MLKTVALDDMKPIRELRIDHIKWENEQKEDRTKHIHVTDLARCLSGVWQEKTGRATPDLNESKLRRFDAGHAIESRVVEACKHAGILKDTQGSLNWPELNMVGSYDLLIQDPEDGQVWLGEVKSIHNYGITHLYKSNKVHEHYKEQINLYLNKLREEYPNIKAFIYYEALDGRTYQAEVDYDIKIVDEAKRKAKILHKAIETDIMPYHPETFIQENGKWSLNWRVKYCIQSGMHYQCDPEPLHPEPDKWINKLEYQAKKRNTQ